MIPQHHRDNFNTLLRAAADGNLALLEVQEKATGQTRYALTTVGQDGEEYILSPFALMIDGDPYEQLNAPDPTGGFVD